MGASGWENLRARNIRIGRKQVTFFSEGQIMAEIDRAVAPPSSERERRNIGGHGAMTMALDYLGCHPSCESCRQRPSTRVGNLAGVRLSLCAACEEDGRRA